MTIGQLNTIISKFPNNWRIESTCEHGYPTKVKSIGSYTPKDKKRPVVVIEFEH